MGSLREVEIEGNALVDMLLKVEERLGNAARAGEQLGNEELVRAARETAVLVSNIRAGLTPLLSLVSRGSMLAAREEACSLGRKLWKMHVRMEEEAPIYFRRMVLEALVMVIGYVEKICKGY